MNAINYYGLEGYLTAAVSAASTILPVDGNLAGKLVAGGFINGESETYLSVESGGVSEVVRVVSVDGAQLAVERGIDSEPVPFSMGSALAFVVTSQAIMTNMGAVSTTVTLQGFGLAEVNSPVLNSWEITVPAPNFVGAGGIDVLGTYPDLTFAYSSKGCCGDGEGGGDAGDALTDIVGTGIATAFKVGSLATVNVLPPSFSGTGITITGTWPNFNFSVPAGSGGTVTSVTAGAGITVTGAPAVNPTVSITNTGVVAGTYGGVQINARGQIVAVPVTFNPVSIITAGTPTVNISRAADAVTIGVDQGGVGVEGTLALADETDPFDPNDNTTAASPAVVALALETVITASVNGADSFTGEPDASYVNTISSTATPITLLAGEKALVEGSVTMLDGTTPSTPVMFGIAIFEATPTKVKSNRIVPQCQQTISFILTGPMNSVLSVVTTAVPGTASVVSSNLAVTHF